MEAPADLANWDDRLVTLIRVMTAAGYVPVDVAQHSSGIVCVARLGLSIPGVVDALRGVMEQLAAIGHREIKEYMEKTIKLFDQDILIGNIMVDVLTQKCNSEGD